MTVRATALLIFVLIACSSLAQTTEQPATKTGRTKARPNIPGNFLVDFGLNGTINSPQAWKQNLFGSRTANVYYQYPLRFGRSRFSFNPGIGLSMERFKWKTFVILNNPVEANANAQIEKYEFAAAASKYPASKKRMFVNNYLEIPVELRFDTKPEDVSRSLNFAIGARAGWLYDSFLKIKYKQDGQWKKVKDKQDWGTTQFRYGVYTRIGIGGFNVFAFYNLTPLFQKDKGPYNEDMLPDGTLVNGTTGTTMQTFTAGISLSGF